MSSQDKLEHVLRDIHVLVSKSEAYDEERIVVRKKDIFDLIDQLNESVYAIMDEYELTQQSRDKALRENKKEGDQIIWEASRQAEDIYAASVMYTDEALNHLNKIIEQTNTSITNLYKDLANNMKKQQETVRENQSELKSQLQLLVDTEKYLKLIEERNKEIEKEQAKKEGRPPEIEHESEFVPIKPEIKVNEEYFRKAGIPLEKDKEENEEEQKLEEGVIEETLNKPEENQVAKDDKEEEKPNVNLDAEYFQWKEDQKANATKSDQILSPEPKGEKLSLLDKLIGKKK